MAHGSAAGEPAAPPTVGEQPLKRAASPWNHAPQRPNGRCTGSPAPTYGSLRSARVSRDSSFVTVLLPTIPNLPRNVSPRAR
ncbi:hypothetical protein RJ55_03686 [Drechmeria coniospora]|nr:hypothetical protein RJ55_03686 [Drechmeria coniospora]